MRNALNLNKSEFVGRIVTHQGRTKALSVSANVGRIDSLLNKYENFSIPSTLAKMLPDESSFPAASQLRRLG